MEKSKVHPSHKMQDDDYGPDNHCTVRCETCALGHCYLCRGTNGMDDDELQAECVGYPWYDSVFDGDKPIGRKSGTGWPSGKK